MNVSLGIFPKRKRLTDSPEMGLYVANRIQFANNSFNVSDSKYINDLGNKHENGVEIYCLNYPGGNQAVAGKFEIAIIHQSLLDKFREKDCERFSTWLKDNVTYALSPADEEIPDWGRQYQFGLELYAKYIPYGNVEYCIKKEFPDKTLLVRMLTSI